MIIPLLLCIVKAFLSSVWRGHPFLGIKADVGAVYVWVSAPWKILCEEAFRRADFRVVYACFHYQPIMAVQAGNVRMYAAALFL